MMDKQSYIEWYNEHYGKNPPAKLLEKYYPVENKEPEKAPEPDIELEDWLS